MVSRRLAVRGGVFAAVAGILGINERVRAEPLAAAAAQRDRVDDGSEKIATAIDHLRDELRTGRPFTEIASIREAQKTFLRVNGKFPDYIEVGTDVWFGVQDWHVRWQQPLAVGRDALGRYTIVLNQTAVILRSDSLPNFVGIPYDSK